MSVEPFEVLAEPTAPRGAAMVHALSGFLDAGGARRIAVEHLLDALEHRTIAAYDLDASYDYRARRPRMVFDTDHYESLTVPELLLSELVDEEGTPFFLLHGPEPDFGWDRFSRAVVALVERYGVGLSVGMNAIPWPAPHTRPVGVTAHATQQNLIAGRRAWVGAIEVPGHLAGLVELRLGEAGHAAMGFAVHIPHYLVNVEHPRAALTLLTEVAGVTGLALPLDSLREVADEADRDIDAQVQANAENVQAISALEAQYDAAMSQSAGQVPLVGEEQLPTGDDLAAQVEQFLRDLDQPGRD